jgi:hypothetical protein
LRILELQQNSRYKQQIGVSKAGLAKISQIESCLRHLEAQAPDELSEAESGELSLDKLLPDWTRKALHMSFDLRRCAGDGFVLLELLQTHIGGVEKVLLLLLRCKHLNNRHQSICLR